MSFHRTRKFQQVQDRWYKKLEGTGFNDAEKKDKKGNLQLKKFDSFYFYAEYTKESFSIKKNYFERAEEFLNTHRFEDDMGRTVWGKHANGFSLRDISKELQIKVHVVRSIILSLKKIMYGK